MFLIYICVSGAQSKYICSNRTTIPRRVKIIHLYYYAKNHLDIKIMFHEDILHRNYINT